MINKAYAAAGLSVSDEQSEKLDKLAGYMVEYNRNVNLTRITEPDEIIEKHYIDSILPLTMVDVPRGTKIIDVGTGAGFPSLPMKIYRPDLEFTLLDSLNKRVTYLGKACEFIGLECEIIHGRGEELGADEKYREKYGAAVSRAVAPLNILCEYCLPFVKKGGVFLALKGGKDETGEAENAVKTLGGKIKEVRWYDLPGGDKRNLVIIEKVAPTPKGYPRVSAKIAKKPL